MLRIKQSHHNTHSTAVLFFAGHAILLLNKRICIYIRTTMETVLYTDLVVELMPYLSPVDQLKFINTCTTIKDHLAPYWCDNDLALQIAVINCKRMPMAYVLPPHMVVRTFIDCCKHANWYSIKQLMQYSEVLQNHRFRGNISIADIVAGSYTVREPALIRILKFLEINNILLTVKGSLNAARGGNIEILHWLHTINRKVIHCTLLTELIRAANVSVLASYVNRRTKIQQRRTRFPENDNGVLNYNHLLCAVHTHNYDMIMYMVERTELRLPLCNFVHQYFACATCVQIQKKVLRSKLYTTIFPKTRKINV